MKTEFIESYVSLAMMGDLDRRVFIKTYWAVEEVKSIGIDNILKLAIGSYSGMNCVYNARLRKN